MLAYARSRVLSAGQLSRQLNTSKIYTWPALGAAAAVFFFVRAPDLWFGCGMPWTHASDFVVAVVLAGLMFVLPLRGLTSRRFAVLMGVLAAIAVIKLTEGQSRVRLGLGARYYFSLEPADLPRKVAMGEYEKSPYSRDPSDVTQIDRDLYFRNYTTRPLGRSFSLDFLNRYTGGRANLGKGIIVQWEGSLLVERPGTRTILIKTDDRAQVQGRVGATPLRKGRNVAVLDRGVHEFRLHYHWRGGDEKLIKVTWGWGKAPSRFTLIRAFVHGKGLTWDRVANARRRLLLTNLAHLALCGLLAALLARWLLNVPSVSAAKAALRSRLFIVYACVVVSAASWFLWHLRHAGLDKNWNVQKGNDYALYEQQASALAVNGFCQDNRAPLHRSPIMRYYVWTVRKLFGTDWTWPICFQHMLRACVGLAAFWLTRELFGAGAFGVSLLALLMVASEPRTARYACKFWPTIPGMLLLTIGMALVVKSRSLEARRACWLYLAAGLALGLGTLFRPNMLAVHCAVLVYLGCLWLRRAQARRLVSLHAACFACGVLAMISLATTRNYIVVKRFVPLCTQGPVNLLAGSNVSRATDFSAIEPLLKTETMKADFELLKKHSLEFSTNPDAGWDPINIDCYVDMNPIILRMWLAYVSQYPLDYVCTVVSKFGQIWWFGKEGRRFRPYFILFVLGLWWLWRTDSLARVGFLAWVILAYAACLALTVIMMRHRLPMVALMSPVMAFGVVMTGRWIRGLFAGVATGNFHRRDG